MKDIAVFGAGGFGREVACLIRMINDSLEVPRWNFIGFFDDNAELKGTRNEYGEVLGGKEVLNHWQTPIDIAIAIGSPAVVQKVAESINNSNIDFPNLIAPTVTVFDANNYTIGKGNIICTNSLISCNVTIGNFNLLNGYITIGHDASIGSYNVIMPSVNISGGVLIGDRNFMGLQSAVIQYLKIGNDTRIGAGAIVMRNTKDGYLYVGVPAKKVDL